MKNVLVNSRLKVEHRKDTDTTVLKIIGNGEFDITAENADIRSIRLSYWDDDGLLETMSAVNFSTPLTGIECTNISLPIIFPVTTERDTKSVLTSVGFEYINRGYYTYFTFFHEGKRVLQLRLNGNFIEQPKKFFITEYVS